MKKNSIIISDNGHGLETLGKRSPDGMFREYEIDNPLTSEKDGKLLSLKDSPSYFEYHD